jgi:FkbM family methyltransferase
VFNLVNKSKKLIQRQLRAHEIYLSRVNQWNGFSLIYEIHRNFLLTCGGILHIGAHAGQEALEYSNLRKEVVWVEAVPEFYDELLRNIKNFPMQKAFCALLGNKNQKSIEFFIASNNGGSSSVFEFGKESNFQSVRMDRKIQLDMKRMDEVFTKSDITNHNHWIIDVQGSELQVLEGAGTLLESCKSIFVEVSLREVYAGGTTWTELRSFLELHGFTPIWEPIQGSHCDVLFLKKGLFD